MSLACFTRENVSNSVSGRLKAKSPIRLITQSEIISIALVSKGDALPRIDRASIECHLLETVEYVVILFKKLAEQDGFHGIKGDM